MVLCRKREKVLLDSLYLLAIFSIVYYIIRWYCFSVLVGMRILYKDIGVVLSVKMKVKHVLLIIILVIMLVLVLDWFQMTCWTDLTGLSSSSSSGIGMENLEEMNVYPKDGNIDYYVITMKNPERLENIEKQSDKLKTQGTPVQIQIVDGVVGVDLNLDELIEQKKLSSEYKDSRGQGNKKKREIGCYMSFLKIYDMIQEKGNSGYSVIFEDDFDIHSDHFLKEIHESIGYLKINNLDFDILYLGVQGYLGPEGNNHGELVDKNLYEIDKKNDLYGCYGMLINNKNIGKIINHMKYIKQAIDVEFTQLCHSEKLKAYVIYPHIVNPQIGKFETTIANENFQQLTDSFKFSHF